MKSEEEWRKIQQSARIFYAVDVPMGNVFEMMYSAQEMGYTRKEYLQFMLVLELSHLIGDGIINPNPELKKWYRNHKKLLTTP